MSSLSGLRREKECEERKSKYYFRNIWRIIGSFCIAFFRLATKKVVKLLAVIELKVKNCEERTKKNARQYNSAMLQKR